MSWWNATPAVFCAVLVVLGPGLFATWRLRAGVLARFGIAALVSVCSWGAAATIFGVVGVPFSPWQVLLPLIIAATLSEIVRRAFPSFEIGPLHARWWIVATAWAIGATIIFFVAFRGVPDPDRISQTYDNVFHLAATAAILDGDSGSPFGFRSLIETGVDGLRYYPSGWHLLTSATAILSGESVAVAFNAVWLVVATAVWLPGVAWLTQVMVAGRLAESAAIAALPLGAATGAFPYALLAWGTIYPTFLAHALLPGAAALTIASIRSVLAGQRRRPGIAMASVAILLSIGALGVSHPRVLPSWALVGALFLTWMLARRFLCGVRRGGTSRRRAIMSLVVTGSAVLVAFGGALTYAIVALGLFTEPLADRLDGPQARAVQTVWQGILQIVGQRSLTAGTEPVTVWAPLLGTAVLAGIAIAVRLRRARWLVAGFVVTAAMFVLAAGSDGDIAKLLTGIWYKDRFRLQATVAVFVVPIAALGVAGVSRNFRARRGDRSGVVLSLGMAAIVAVVSGASLSMTGTSQAIADVFHQPERRADWEIVSDKQVAFMQQQVAQIVPEGERVLGNPWDGSALTQLYAQREPVFPHVNGQWDADRLTVAWHLDEIEGNPEVCAALQRLSVTYVLYNPHEFGGGDPAGNHFPGPHEAVENGRFTEVATDGESVLYRIDVCG
ncbi:DUF6541 family protein [Microbacterium amylolyticum]|uniref:Uncharacterized protein n=1 Tax=Microbacterium amylolyticum TaxID=936337 RepID=A0ABS4ZJV1_9MICO|nr:DUF6541 family protein [Microbacterium amylolyticum]MBP2437569.1 hypothetical protein [Microbacterium amylolyticum]